RRPPSPPIVVAVSVTSGGTRVTAKRGGFSRTPANLTAFRSSIWRSRADQGCRQPRWGPLGSGAAMKLSVMGVMVLLRVLLAETPAAADGNGVDTAALLDLL